MAFNSVNFLIFFPVVTLVYFLIPQKGRTFWLLLSSYYFYGSWNPKYLFLILLITVITWIGGIAIGKIDKNVSQENGVLKKKLCLAFCLLSAFLILAVFKYYNFFSKNLQTLFSKIGIAFQMPSLDLLLPVGISFYTFQAAGYIIDVYRGAIEPEKSFLHYALFISFFPQLVAGPIERSKNLIGQIHETHYYNSERVVKGLLLMGWGFFKKMVIADRAALLVTPVYDHFLEYSGLQIAVATVVFAVQIYCDFSGYSDIAVGAAQVMGFHLMENFHSPYYSKSVSEFWRRWHISLSTWFRDYLYIPLGGNRKGKWKQYRNLLITFCVSGLWHGASWNYVVWGGLNGIFQVLGSLTEKLRNRVKKMLHINTRWWGYRFFQGLVTFSLIDFSWLFFRADGCKTAIKMLQHAVANPGWHSMLNPEGALGFKSLALDEKNFCVLLVSVLILAVVDALKDKVHFRTLLLRQNLVVRYIVYYVIIFVIAVFGIYGLGYDAATFIYFQF